MDIKKDFKLYAKSRGISENEINRATDNIFAPYILEERKMNCQALDIFSRMLYDRIVFFNGEVNEDSVNVAIAQLLYLDSIEHRDINFYINSRGGEITNGLAVIDTMNFIKSEVSTIGIGMAASMGAMLLISGEKGKRFALPHTRILLHQPSAATSGRLTDMEIDLKEYQKNRSFIYEILSKRMGKKIEEITEICKSDLWLSPKEAVEMKIIDKVIEK